MCIPQPTMSQPGTAKSIPMNSFVMVLAHRWLGYAHGPLVQNVPRHKSRTLLSDEALHLHTGSLSSHSACDHRGQRIALTLADATSCQASTGPWLSGSRAAASTSRS